MHIIHVDVHTHAKEDLDLIWESDPEAAAITLAVLEQLEADPKAIDKLTTYGDNDAGATLINVKPWQKMRKRADLWRFRILDTPATSYRVIYGYQWQTRQLCVLAIVHKEKLTMTTSTAPLPSESLPTGAPSSPKSNPTALIYEFEFSAPRPLPQPGSVNVDALVKEAEADTTKASYMQQARKRLAATLYADEPETLSALRLVAGYSQAQLADKASTSQPHIARIERGQTDPGTDMVARIAKALGVDEMRVYRAIRKQLETRRDPA